MSTRPCAPEPRPGARCGRLRAGAAFLLCSLVLAPSAWTADAPPVASAPAAAEVIVVRVTLNAEVKGDLFVGRTADLDFLLKVEDLRAMGVKDLAGRTVIFEGEPHLSLRSMAGVSFAFEERSLALDISADPRLLPGTAYSLASRPTRSAPPQAPSGYLNYALRAERGEPGLGTRAGLAGEAGWRWGHFLVQTDATHTWDLKGQRHFVRLMSSVTHDDLPNLRRTVVGDFFTPSRDLSTGSNLGGIAVSKVYGLDPYLVRFPTQSISGNVALPSELEVYVDGYKVRTQQLRPGEFDLRDISSFGGAQSVQLVLRDPFGRVQQLSYSFYFSDQPLQPGLHEYSYNLGAFRRRFGQASSSYGPAAMNVFHRYGLNRYLTVGFRAEGTRKLTNVGPLATLVLGNAGVVNMALVQSAMAGNRGAAASLAYSYQTRGWNVGVSVRHDARHYAALGDPPTRTNRKDEGSIGASYQLPGHGNVSLTHSALTTRSGVQASLPRPAQPYLTTLFSPRRATALTYSAPLLSGRVSFTTSISHVRDKLRGSRNEAFVGFTFLLDKDHSLAGNARRERGEHSESVRLVKSQPIGEGVGYTIGLDRAALAQDRSTLLNSSIQYNAPAAVLRAEYNRSRARDTFQDYRVSVAGNLSYVGGHAALGRPVTGSFGIAKVGELADVEVLLEGQYAGRTNSQGKIFLPTLNPYFDNEVSINAASVPIEYSISSLARKVSPSLRGGVLVDFAVTKVQAFTGHVSVNLGSETRPIEFREASLTAAGKPVKFQTGRGGEYYLENLPPGTYPAAVEFEDRPCRFDILIPKSDATFVELGAVTCRLAP